MKRLLLGLGAVLLLGAAVAWSGTREPGEFVFPAEKTNPVSNFAFNNNRADFQFAIISDRTGGHRARVFSRAVDQLNLLQPEFVLSVGDLIEGYTRNREVLAQEWREFQGYLGRLQMPFFFVPGNHDLANAIQDKLWQEKFGRSYYEFVYRNVLFLMLNSEDPPGIDYGHISPEQLAWLEKTLAANKDVRWTLVFVHKPMWAAPKPEEGGWVEVEKFLKDRPYTVFAGHIHSYYKYVRQGRNYYQLATTGGASRVRGVEYGEFDHIVWVTMKKDGPVLANVLLDGVLPEDLRRIDSPEEGAPLYYRRPTYPVTARVFLEGKPIPGAYVVFHGPNKEPRPVWADGLVEADGTVRLSTYTANDGAPAGEYTITVERRKPRFDPNGKPGPNDLPARYASEKTSGLTVTVKPGVNNLDLELKNGPAGSSAP
jgi:hypothetical protein